MGAPRHVAKGPVLSVTDTLRELGLPKTKASALAREVEKLVDEVVPRTKKKATTRNGAKRHSSVSKRSAKSRGGARSSVLDAA